MAKLDKYYKSGNFIIGITTFMFFAEFIYYYIYVKNVKSLINMLKTRL